LIPSCKEKDMLALVKTALPQITFNKMNVVKNHKKFVNELLQFEKLQVANNYKWGVLYMKDGQEENDMYQNG
jgi:predicted alpha/beta superfamily hydrolase